MSRHSIRAGDFVVVSDGRKALLLENVGDDVFANLETREVYEREDAPNRMLNSDKPGRLFQSAASSRRSSVEQTDRHEMDERNFVRGLMDRVHELVVGGATTGLVIAAPPHVLGLIRKYCSNTVKSVIHAEFGHDLTHLPIHEIEKRLVDAAATEGPEAKPL